MNYSFRILALASVVSLIGCGDDKGTSVVTSSSSSVASSSSSATRTSLAPMTVDAGLPADCTPANAANIEVVSPATATILVPGDTVVIRWKTLVADFTGYVPAVSIDGGKTWGTPLDPVVTGSVPSQAQGAAAQCLSYTTIIPADGSYTPGDKENASVLFRVKDYNSSQANMRDVSDTVTILAP